MNVIVLFCYMLVLMNKVGITGYLIGTGSQAGKKKHVF